MCELFELILLGTYVIISYICRLNVLMVILLSAALAGRAQGDYIPLNVDGMVWTMWNKLSVPTGDGRVSYERYKAEGDTIIDGSKFEILI